MMNMDDVQTGLEKMRLGSTKARTNQNKRDKKDVEESSSCPSSPSSSTTTPIVNGKMKKTRRKMKGVSHQARIELRSKIIAEQCAAGIDMENIIDSPTGPKHINGKIEPQPKEQSSTKATTICTAQSEQATEIIQQKQKKSKKKRGGGSSKNESPVKGVSTKVTANAVGQSVGVGGGAVHENHVGKKKNKENLQSSADVTPRKKNKKGSGKNHHDRQLNHHHVQEDDSKFEPYLCKDEVVKGLADGTLVKGVIRINPKFHTEAYVTRDDKSLQDYYIGTLTERNKALEGDVVVLRLKPEEQWRDEQPRASVVYILEKVHPRLSVGQLSMSKDKKGVIFKPRDKRVPFMTVLEVSLPANYMKNPHKFANTLFMGQLIDWPVPKFGVGSITENIGKSNDLLAETRAILLEHQVNFAPFPPDFDIFLPKFKGIPIKEYSYRENLTEECVFTIDPLTAKDLDDAVSCKRLENGNYEVGVHIADVAFHLAENTPLDEMVCSKATTTYLVDNVYHMLPQELCMMCSLLPGKENLAFSVFWEMDDDGEVLKHRFARTIIKSCCKLAYEHAQDIIENASPVASDFPDILNDCATFVEVCEAVRTLNRLAHRLREKRVKNGAIRIDQIKLGFTLDGNGDPDSYYVQQMRDANRMIEDFMLLANMTVARRIHDDFPQMAFLRCHDEPNGRMLSDVKRTLEIIGIHIGIEDSSALSQSLIKYDTGDYLGYVRHVAINHMLAKPMVRAEYFCADDRCVSDFRHFALAVPIYTHFTSPIRRYPDVMVHRLLSASLGYTPKPDWPVARIREIADNCNKQKYNAKRAGEASVDLYLAHYIEKRQPFHDDAVVVAVQEKSFDAITLNTGSQIRIYSNTFEEAVHCHTECNTYGDKQIWKMNVIFPSGEDTNAVLQVVELFQVVQVALNRKDKTNKLEARLIRPKHVKSL
ncbi:PREDICTED: DIS3-like exonuclease 2 [Nicrophorus vespilloides]|uniref:DIS3-like exonuclease 2 n=1 Tax=Nicrophorus vespilloides TaxID=110193 RepID=A0ABM1NFJ8_NICVS|nr:PREDICTED: DIS3-like exonuclease 2 [Nicrophorus vespilloides]